MTLHQSILHNEETGEYYLPKAKSFLIQQNKKFPDMSSLYKSQTKKVIEGASKELRDSLKKVVRY